MLSPAFSFSLWISLLLDELELVQLLSIISLFYLDIQLFDLLTHLFDINDVLQKLIVAHSKLNVDNLARSLFI